jgi:hypothetical protein
MSGGAVFGTILGVLLLILMVLWIYRKGAQASLPGKSLLKGVDDDRDEVEIANPLHSLNK